MGEHSLPLEGLPEAQSDIDAGQTDLVEHLENRRKAALLSGMAVGATCLTAAGIFETVLLFDGAYKEAAITTGFLLAGTFEFARSTYKNELEDNQL